MSNDAPIQFQEASGKGGSLGIITLYRPEALNALNRGPKAY